MSFIRALFMRWAGGTPAHSLIGANITITLGAGLRNQESTCTVYNSDLKVRIDAAHSTFYPDVTVACETPEFSTQDGHALTNPMLIIEVLSDSTEAMDRGEKSFAYRQLPSLKVYMLVSQHIPQVDMITRQDDDLWQPQTLRGLDKVIHMPSIGISLSLAEYLPWGY